MRTEQAGKTDEASNIQHYGKPEDKPENLSRPDVSYWLRRIIRSTEDMPTLKITGHRTLAPGLPHQMFHHSNYHSI